MITADGSHTIFLPEMNEQYHSVNGAITESEYVFIKQGFQFCDVKKPVIFEAGFGTGLNCLLTALESEKSEKQTTYNSIEKYPLNKSWTDKLNYGHILSEKAREIYQKLHECAWDETVEISEYFKLKKIAGDLNDFDLSSLAKFNIIYFDAFGPDKQPEMWSTQIFQKIYRQTFNNGIFVTYSAKGEVRRNLSSCGFTMERLPGPPGKKQMLRGIKRL